MTLPVSPNPITMGLVKSELGLSSSTILTLTDSRVRTLFGKPSGVIKLTDGYGKSAINWARPTSASYTGITPINPTYAYDTPTVPNSVDASSYSSYSSSVSVDSTQTYSFSGNSITGTLYIRVREVSTDHVQSEDHVNEATSYVNITATIDGGSNWIPLGNWSGGDSVADTTLSMSISNKTLSSISVRVQAVSREIGYGRSSAIASVECDIADIVIY